MQFHRVKVLTAWPIAPGEAGAPLQALREARAQMRAARRRSRADRPAPIQAPRPPDPCVQPREAADPQDLES